MSALANASRTRHGILADGAVRVRDSDVALGGRSNLLLRGIDGNGVEKGPAQVHAKRNVHDHRRCLGIGHVLPQESYRRAGVSEVGGEEVRSGIAIEVANNGEKSLVGLQDVSQGVENRVFGVSHCLLSPKARKSLSPMNKTMSAEPPAPMAQTTEEATPQATQATATVDLGSKMSLGMMIVGVLSALYILAFHIGAAVLSYQKFGSLLWATLDFFFPYFYYPYYAFVASKEPAPVQEYVGGASRRVRVVRRTRFRRL
jgi:hypothetical protein